MNAISISPEARYWLSNSQNARILHLFDRACNVINEHGDVLSLVTQEIGDGPFNMLIENNGQPFSKYLNIQSKITIHPDLLVLGELAIDTRRATLTYSKPAWDQLHNLKEKVIQNLVELDDWIKPLVPKDSLMNSLNLKTRELKNPFGKLDTSKAEQALAALSTLANELCTAIIHADPEGCKRATKRLAGSGGGLTPAGDDYIYGAMLAAWMIHPQALAGAICEEAARTAAPLTTSLSEAWLRAGSRGEAGAAWLEFFKALSRDDKRAIQTAARNLISIGHTSGADALAGFAATCVRSMTIGILQ
jgi:hypothetical protein